MALDQAANLRKLVQHTKNTGQESLVVPEVPLPDQSLSTFADIKNKQMSQNFAVTKSSCRVIAVTSGKGGVGKTNITVNLAIALAKNRQKVIILDGDLGLANVDLVLGIHPKYNLKHVLSGEKRPEEIIVDGPENIRVLPGGSGLYSMANITGEQALKLLKAFSIFENQTDYLLIDTAAGISSNVIDILVAAGEIIIVTTPEPTSVTDAYGLIKVAYSKRENINFKLIVNFASDQADAKDTAQRIISTAKHFLGLEVGYYGFIPLDKNVAQAVRKQEPFLLSYPKSPASLGLLELTRNVMYRKPDKTTSSNIISFFKNFIRA